MRTCIDQLLALPHIDAPSLKGEVHYLAGRLEQLRIQRTISNEAYLDAEPSKVPLNSWRT